MVSFLSLLLFIWTFLNTKTQVPTTENMKNLVISIIFLVSNIFLHELFHCIFLHIFGGSRGRVKFKMNFIFPTITVDTSDVYLLPRLRRFFVYSAGIGINSICCGLLAILYPDLIVVALPVFWALLASLLPFGVITTDGFNILYNAILDIDEIQNKDSVPYIISKYIFLIFIISLMCFSFIKIWLV